MEMPRGGALSIWMWRDPILPGQDRAFGCVSGLSSAWLATVCCHRSRAPRAERASRPFASLGPRKPTPALVILRPNRISVKADGVCFRAAHASHVHGRTYVARVRLQVCVSTRSAPRVRFHMFGSTCSAPPVRLRLFGSTCLAPRVRPRVRGCTRAAVCVRLHVCDPARSAISEARLLCRAQRAPRAGQGEAATRPGSTALHRAARKFPRRAAAGLRAKHRSLLRRRAEQAPDRDSSIRPSWTNGSQDIRGTSWPPTRSSRCRRSGRRPDRGTTA
jgi:hypothetical protein